MPKTKSRTTRLLGKFEFDKTLIIVIVTVVVAACGYMFYRGSQAATSSSALSVDNSYTTPVKFTTTDGVVSNGTSIVGTCHVIALKSAFGNLARCVQVKYTSADKSKFQMRNVIYNISAKKYIPEGDWVTGSELGLGPVGTSWMTCTNTGNLFADVGIIRTAYGVVYSGVEFKKTWTSLTASKWQARFSNLVPGKDLNKGTCGANSTTGWMDTVGRWL